MSPLELSRVLRGEQLDLKRLRAVRTSNANQLDVTPELRGERLEVLRVRHYDVVAVFGEQDERGLDHVRAARTREQVSHRAPQGFVQWTDFDAFERAGKKRLPRTAATPRLPQTPPCDTGTLLLSTAPLSRRHMARSFFSSAMSAPASSTRLIVLIQLRG
jgi:hypothetical protein